MTLSRYKAKSLPYQRIYLMHGPPGNGKSSFLQALAITYSMKLYILQVSSKQMNASSLKSLLAATNKTRCIVAVRRGETTPSMQNANA
jgi:chaperone BCS1